MRKDSSNAAKDEIFQDPSSGLQPFSFNETVACVFDDMASRSIPAYRELHDLCASIVERFILSAPSPKVVDIGCSTGATLLAIAQRLNEKEMSLVGVDNSPPMIERFRQKLLDTPDTRISLMQSAFEDLELHDVSAVLLNYTLQFISPEWRPSLMKKCFDGMRPGGIVILSEKTYSAIPEVQEVITERYERFKEMNGYKREEIRNKASALTGVLIPFTVEENIELLKRSGFSRVELLMKNHHFTTFLGIKPD